MKKKFHHIVLFNYQGNTMIFETILSRRLFPGDLMSLLILDLLKDDLVHSPATNVEMFIDDERVYSLPVLNVRKNIVFS